MKPPASYFAKSGVQVTTQGPKEATACPYSVTIRSYFMLRDDSFMEGGSQREQETLKSDGVLRDM